MMKPDMVMTACGIMSVDDINENARSFMGEWVKMFLKGGGTVSLNDWQLMNPETRAIFVDQKNELEAEKISAMIYLSSRRNLGEILEEKLEEVADGDG